MALRGRKKLGNQKRVSVFMPRFSLRNDFVRPGSVKKAIEAAKKDPITADYFSGLYRGLERQGVKGSKSAFGRKVTPISEIRAELEKHTTNARKEVQAAQHWHEKRRAGLWELEKAKPIAIYQSEKTLFEMGLPITAKVFRSFSNESIGKTLKLAEGHPRIANHFIKIFHEFRKEAEAQAQYFRLPEQKFELEIYRNSVERYFEQLINAFEKAKTKPQYEEFFGSPPKTIAELIFNLRRDLPNQDRRARQ